MFQFFFYCSYVSHDYGDQSYFFKEVFIFRARTRRQNKREVIFSRIWNLSRISVLFSGPFKQKRQRNCSADKRCTWTRKLRAKVAYNLDNLCTNTMPLRKKIGVLPSHMTAEQKWCFLNWSKCETNIFQLRSPHRFRESSNQIHLLFGTITPKMG